MKPESFCIKKKKMKRILTWRESRHCNLCLSYRNNLSHIPAEWVFNKAYWNKRWFPIFVFRLKLKHWFTRRWQQSHVSYQSYYTYHFSFVNEWLRIWVIKRSADTVGMIQNDTNFSPENSISGHSKKLKWSWKWLKKKIQLWLLADWSLVVFPWAKKKASSIYNHLHQFL